MQKIAAALEKHKIDTLLLIGGWEALEVVHRVTLMLAQILTIQQGMVLLDKKKDKFPKLGLTKVLIPATISNNLPATEFSIGSDTSLNNILDALDKIKQVSTLSTMD